MTKFQQPVIFFPNIIENQNPWHMNILNMYTKIQENRKLFYLKAVGGVSWTNDIPCIKYLLSFLKNDSSTTFDLPNIN
jgi:hypothetical protein